MSAQLSRATREAAIAAAKEKGCAVVEPKGNEIFIDIDSAAERVHFDNAIARIKSRWPCEVKITPSPSGAEHHAHIVVAFPKPSATIENSFSALERIALQAVLGSDLKRELNSVCDVLDGDPLPTIFFEREVILWDGHEMVVGKCADDKRCLACERLGRHLEPKANEVLF
jgi:hypothetical protein